MKHGSEILRNFFDKQVDPTTSLPDGAVEIQGFHLGALTSLVNSIHDTLLIVSPQNLYSVIDEYLVPNWEINCGLALPDPLFIAPSPAGFLSEDERRRQISKSIIQSFPRDIRFILSTEAALRESCFSYEKTPPLEVDKNILFDSLIGWLISAEYVVGEIVVRPGAYAIRGGIVDVFPISSNSPVRINFLADEVDLFSFNIDSQMTTDKLSLVKIPPVDRGNKDGVSFFDVFTENLTKIHVTDENTIIIGNHVPPNKTIRFPFSPLPLKEFINQRSKGLLNFEIDLQLTGLGFIHECGRIIVPPWFETRGQASTATNIAHQSQIIDFDKIEQGDILAHNDYGLCRYLGLKQNEDAKAEFILLEFEENGLISLSVQMIRKLTFYASSNQPGVSLDSLTKTKTWKRKKASAESRAEEIVDKLLMSYAERTSTTRNPYKYDSEIEDVLLARFPYSDTLDQETAWNEISNDMSFSNQPMNRLLCGDVGFGKTEIAVRASFRSVYNGKQVAVLAPTTILVNQLFSTFKSRLDEFSISIGMVSRFRSGKEIKETLNNLASGNLDIIIGTHSLLSDRVTFANLGLLIIDEEQRFGVNQKEKIQELQKNLDVLSMSATPIPRTLHLATSGIRDISTLQTPPVSRHPINTQISFFDIETIKRAVFNEIRRGGQVFFVHNEVKTILEMFSLLTEHFPLLKISVAHGQEPATTLEKTIIDFQNHKTDILICSSIIETGIDIPNTNTIIINKAHRFGLSQLHQIRGRVGRSNRKAFALLLVPKGLTLNNNAFRRLKAIEKHSGLGEGYNISTMDLEIRGAGTVLGYQQSGGVGRVGSELYTQLINQALKQKLNPKSIIDLRPDQISVSIFNDGTIPHSYIHPTGLRLDFYRRLAQANTADDILETEYALENRFGPIPELVQHLIFETNIRIRCCVLGVDRVALADGVLVFGFVREYIVSRVGVFLNAVNDYFSNYNYKYWYKEESSGKIKIFVSGISLEDIPSTIDRFFDKLYDAFNKK